MRGTPGIFLWALFGLRGSLSTEMEGQMPGVVGPLSLT